MTSHALIVRTYMVLPILAMRNYVTLSNFPMKIYTYMGFAMMRENKAS